MKKVFRIICWIFFFAWVGAIFYILFIMNRINTQGLVLGEYLKDHIYIIPFKTLFGYIDSLSKNVINPAFVVKNLLGNILLFAPMGVLLPIIIRQFNSAIKLAVTAFIANIVLELAQLLLMLGDFNIDEILLRVIGAVIGFVVWYLGDKVVNPKKKLPKNYIAPI